MKLGCAVAGVLYDPAGRPVEFFSFALQKGRRDFLGASVKGTFTFEAELLAVCLALAAWAKGAVL